MAKGTVNKVILIGRLGADPEIRNTPNGATVGNFNLATNRVFKGKDGNQVEETDWHRVVLWNRTAELARDYLHKGSKVYVEGRLQTRSYDDETNTKRYITEVICIQMQFLGSSNGDSNGNAHSQPAAQNAAPGYAEPDDQDVPF